MKGKEDRGKALELCEQTAAGNALGRCAKHDMCAVLTKND
jgi:hypothetical protein